MTDLKSRANELIMEVIDDAQAHAFNPDKYTICIAKESLAALTRFVHALCECAEASASMLSTCEPDAASDLPALSLAAFRDWRDKLRAALAALEKGEKA